MSFGNGELVGPYRIIEKLGQGGMATVFKAHHAALNRFVALKVLHSGFNDDGTLEARFQREALLVANLDHAHIIPVYDYSEYARRPYLVMKYVEGGNLKTRLAQGSLRPELIFKVAQAVGSALAYAHQNAVLHRDVKPSNVLLAGDQGIFLTDFGLAHMSQAPELVSASDTVLGTPQYISPEQALGKTDLDAGADIYSFGVMLYEMVVGRVPFDADTASGVIHDHIYTPLPLPRTLNPGVSEAVERILRRALAKNRIDRYKDVGTMLNDFTGAWMTAYGHDRRREPRSVGRS